MLAVCMISDASLLSESVTLLFLSVTHLTQEQLHCKKKKELGYLKILSQPAKADFWVFSTYFLGNFSTFCCINLKQEVEKTQKSAEAGCLKILSLPNFFFLQCKVVKGCLSNL